MGIVHAKETNAQAIAGYLCDFIKSKDLRFENLRGLGFDGTNTMSGHRSGVRCALECMHQVPSMYTAAAISCNWLL